MSVILHAANGVDENPLPFANARRVGPYLRSKFCRDGFAPILGAEHDMNYILSVGVRHVSHLRCLPFYTLGTQRSRAGLTCDAPTALEEGGACRRRGRRGRGGGRRVRRRSGGARGRGGGENHRPVFPLSGRCIPYSWRPGCGRNCALRVPAARRGPGTGPTARCCASSRSIGRARARGWTFAASRSSESPPPRG